MANKLKPAAPAPKEKLKVLEPLKLTSRYRHWKQRWSRGLEATQREDGRIEIEVTATTARGGESVLVNPAEAHELGLWLIRAAFSSQGAAFTLRAPGRSGDTEGRAGPTPTAA